MSAPKVELYFHPLSQPSRSAHWILKILNVDFSENVINLMKGEHRTEGYKKINRLCKVPAVVHGEFKVAESFAILAYVAKKFGAGTSWYPEDLEVQARMHEYISWHLGSLQKTCAGWIYNACFAAEKNESLIAEKRLAHLASLDLMEENFLQAGKAFITGDEPTIADLMAACDVAQLHMVEFSMDGRPNLKAWFDNVRKLPHYDAVHAVMMTMKKSSF